MVRVWVKFGFRVWFRINQQGCHAKEYQLQYEMRGHVLDSSLGMRPAHRHSALGRCSCSRHRKRDMPARQPPPEVPARTAPIADVADSRARRRSGMANAQVTSATPRANPRASADATSREPAAMGAAPSGALVVPHSALTEPCAAVAGSETCAPSHGLVCFEGAPVC